MGRFFLLLVASAAALFAFAAQTVTAVRSSTSVSRTYYHCYYPKYNNYCYKSGGQPYCGKDGFWHYDRSDCSGRHPQHYNSRKCQWGSGYWKRGYGWYYPKSTCYKSYKCTGPIDWSQCGGDWSGKYYGGPYCKRSSDGEYDWSYDKCSYCNPNQYKGYVNKCHRENSNKYSAYCLYNTSKNYYAYDCCNCPANEYEKVSDSCDDNEYVYCKDDGEWGCQMDEGRK